MKHILLSIFCILLLSWSPVFWDYQLTQKDFEIIEKYNKKSDSIVETKWEKQKEFMIYTLTEAQENYKENERLYGILTELISHIAKPKDIVWGKEFQDLNIDIEQVKNSWISWINEERNSLWVPLYTYDYALEKTALLWSQLAKQKWLIDHKVSPWDSYYDYYKKASWMKEHGVVCKNLYRVTFSESIGWWVFSCSDTDCTQELTDAIEGSFDFYMNEKWKEYKPHYEAIAGKLFTIMWLGIELEKTSNTRYKYYLTNHYCTQLQ